MSSCACPRFRRFGGLVSDAGASVKEDLETAAADGEGMAGARRGRKSVRELAGGGEEVGGAGRGRGESQAKTHSSSDSSRRILE